MQFSATSLLIAATMVISVAAAETTQLQLFSAGRVNISALSLVASVVGANTQETTLAFQCGPDSPAACQMNGPAMITQGPSTFTMSAIVSIKTGSLRAKGTWMQDCDITASTEGASCSISIGVEATSYGLSVSTSITLATSYKSDNIQYAPITVTAGVDKLNAPRATETPDAATGALNFGGAAAAALVAALGVL